MIEKLKNRTKRFFRLVKFVFSDYDYPLDDDYDKDFWDDEIEILEDDDNS